jgi:hypothetical protein
VSGWQRNHRVKERCEGFAVLGQSVSAGSSFDVKLRVKMCDVLAIVGAMSFDGECHGAVSFRLDDSENGKAGEKRQHGKGILHGLGSLLLLNVVQAFAWHHDFDRSVSPECGAVGPEMNLRLRLCQRGHIASADCGDHVIDCNLHDGNCTLRAMLDSSQCLLLLGGHHLRFPSLLLKPPLILIAAPCNTFGCVSYEFVMLAWHWLFRRGIVMGVWQSA